MARTWPRGAKGGRCGHGHLVISLIKSSLPVEIFRRFSWTIHGNINHRLKFASVVRLRAKMIEFHDVVKDCSPDQSEPEYVKLRQERSQFDIFQRSRPGWFTLCDVMLLDAGSSLFWCWNRRSGWTPAISGTEHIARERWLNSKTIFGFRECC